MDIIRFSFLLLFVVDRTLSELKLKVIPISAMVLCQLPNDEKSYVNKFFICASFVCFENRKKKKTSIEILPYNSAEVVAIILLATLNVVDQLK